MNAARAHWWHWRGSTLGLALAVLAVGWLTALGGTLWTLRAASLSQGTELAVVHARHLEGSLTQSLQAIEQTAISLDVADGQSLRNQSTGDTLRQLLRPVPYLRSMSVVDARGVVLASSNPENLGVRLSVMGFFPVVDSQAEVIQVGRPQVGRDISHSWAGPPSLILSPADRYFIPVLRKLASGQGDFWLLVALNPDHFITEGLAMVPEAHGFVQWLRFDDVLLVSSHSADEPGASAAAGPLSWQPPQPEAGHYHHRLSDGTAVLSAFRVSERFPMVVAVHLQEDAVLAPWRQQVQRWVAVMVPVLLALLTLSVAMWRRHRRLVAKQAELDEQQRLAASVFESSSDAIVVTDANACVLSANAALERVTGYTVAEVLGQNARFMSSGLHPPEFFQAMYATLLDQGHWQGEIINRHKLGHLYTAELTINAVYDNDGVLQHFSSVVTDVTEQRDTQQRLQLAASVFTHANEGIMITSPGGDIIDVNDAFTRITGYACGEVLGRNASVLSSGRQGLTFYQQMWKTLDTQGRWTGEIWNRRKSGEVYVEMLTITAVRGPDGAVLRYVALFSDISLQKEHEERLDRIAHYDGLTGLPNRVLLADRLRQAMLQTVRRAQLLALVFLDLDGFKSVNDNHGHDAGDQLLIELSHRMKTCLREGDTLARLGGDEFVAVLPDLGDHQAAVPVLDRLLAAASQPFGWHGHTLEVSASVGVVFYPQAYEMDAEQLMRQADQAMYQAKLMGKNRYQVFDAEQDRHIRGRHETLTQIRQALQRREFVLHFQPKVNMRTGQVVGAEALIRWQHPTRGLLRPAEFLPALHKDPLAIDLGEWVMETAIVQVGAWKAQGVHLPVSINIDARHLQHPEFFHGLRQHLGRHPSVMPGDLELEVLETSALDDLDAVSSVMNRCRELGVGFAIDDFGTGYSSLTYLRRLPASLLKIDQSFVRGMLDDTEDLAILEGVLGLARAFRTQALAEGVETTAHGEMLLRLGCDWAQGYAIARPMPPEDMPAWVASWRTDPAWAHVARAHREDLPLLTAMVEHRAWAAQLRAMAMGQRDASPPLHFQERPMGRWLMQAECEARHGHRAAFARLNALHAQIHALAAEVLHTRQTGTQADVQAILHRLADLDDQLVATLQHLLDASD